MTMRKKPKAKPTRRTLHASARSTQSKRRRSGTKAKATSLLDPGNLHRDESTDNHQIIPVNRPIQDRDLEQTREINDMRSKSSRATSDFLIDATETVCHVAEEEAIAIGNGARRLYRALAGLGVGVAILASSCLILTAFKADDSQASTVRKARDLKLDQWLADLQPLAYGIPAIQANLPVAERRILAEVAHEYGLDRDQTLLLFAIRKIENGQPGLELGCGDGIPGHPARRYAGDFEKSLRLQAAWSSGTIRNNWDGDIHAFSRIYCPVRHGLWARNASKWVGILGAEENEE